MRFNPFRSRVPLPATDAKAFTEELIAKTAKPSTVAAGKLDLAPLDGGDTTSPPQLPAVTIACMVTHGMGQQVPFATVSSLTEAFVRGRTPSTVKANRVVLTPNSDLISRMELVYTAAPGVPQTTVHIYEGYWAPLTEGKIGLLATLLFLLSGAWEGLKSGLRPLRGRRGFERWIFGKLIELPIKPGTVSYIFIALAALAIIVALFYVCESRLHAAYEALKYLVDTSKGHPVEALWSALVNHLHFLWHLLESGQLHSFFVNVLVVLTTPLLLAASAAYVAFLRYAVIEYIGDVAIYVSAYKVSSYEEVRKAIQKTVFEVGSQIFQAVNGNNGQGYLYDKVIFVGHSLGSVITYDLINALIVWDVFRNQGRYRVVERTGQLITFGSPLDKTAFLFRTQISPDHHYREALAALQQPIILDYQLRPFKWINLYSRADAVSGSLAYYDIPPDPPHPPPKGYRPDLRVHNEPDPAAWIPLYAHVQYWSGEKLRDTLQNAIR